MAFGLIMVPLVKCYVGSDQSDVQFVASLYSGFYFIFSFLIGLLYDKFGYRAVMITGSCIATLGFFLAPFANSIWIVVVLIGIIASIGHGAVVYPSNLTVSYYFEGKR